MVRARVLRLGNRRIVRFGVVGLIGVGVNVLILRILHGEFGLFLPLASAITVEITIVTNFLLNNWWTFHEHSISARRFARYNLASLGGLAITTGVLTVLTSRVGVQYILADLVGIAVATVWNYATSTLWTWAK